MSIWKHSVSVFFNFITDFKLRRSSSFKLDIPSHDCTAPQNTDKISLNQFSFSLFNLKGRQSRYLTDTSYIQRVLNKKNNTILRLAILSLSFCLVLFCRTKACGFIYVSAGGISINSLAQAQLLKTRNHIQTHFNE